MSESVETAKRRNIEKKATTRRLQISMKGVQPPMVNWKSSIANWQSVLKLSCAILASLLPMVKGHSVSAQAYEITRHTIDGGGAMFSTSSDGQYELSGTIGQADAGGPLTGPPGSGYELTGGFWSALVSGDCSVTSTPANCTIDARRPHAPGNPAAAEGYNSVFITFEAGCGVSGAIPGDFSVACTPAGAPCPTITSTPMVDQTVAVNFSSVIPAGKWTCVTHTGTGKQICLGSLPADANGNRAAGPSDILDLIDNLNGLPPPLPINQCDIDRSNVCLPADVLSEIDLLNGVSGFQVWNGRTLPVCPSAP